MNHIAIPCLITRPKDRKSRLSNAFFYLLLTGSLANINPVYANDDSVEKGASASTESTTLLWGDTHLHTSNSFDAFLNGNVSADPDTAYNYAKGVPVIHPYHRARIQINTPLDFLVVADHAELYGVVRRLYKGGDGVKEDEFVGQLRKAVNAGKGSKMFSSLLPIGIEDQDLNPILRAVKGIFDGGDNHDHPLLNSDHLTKQGWAEAIAAADKHNQPGKFSAFIGWEWSAVPSGSNLHRIVFTDSNSEVAKQFLPYGSDQSEYPDDLWKWLEKTSNETGADFVAIPHNSNISKGFMFPSTTTLRDKPIDAPYAQTRARWEPVVEVTQIKGDSETAPKLSPQDPFADFEMYTHFIQQNKQKYHVKEGSFVRSALKTGLQIEQKLGVNPYKLGMVGSTDSHTGIASAEENNFWGKMAIDSVPENKRDARIGMSVTGWDMSASGLAAVWAEENTREAIFAAFKRREVYASTGPRIQVRLFAGWDFQDTDAQSESLADIGYTKGVPMGGDLLLGDNSDAPQFLMHAIQDPKSASLDRMQIVKGWVDAKGQSHEKVYNVAWAGQHATQKQTERKADKHGKLAAIGNSVDPLTGTYDNNLGATDLATVWQDPDFDATQRAFYYVRVLEIPTPRHSTLDALALKQKPTNKEATFIQERAYTSPIWYTPKI